jgi:glycosyltransferase involved in cell wall biosynthesis
MQPLPMWDCLISGVEACGTHRRGRRARQGDRHPGHALRIAEVNTLLTGGGTDDRSVRMAGALHRAGHDIWLVGPRHEEYSQVAAELGLRTHPLRTRGWRRWLLPLQIARLVNRKVIQILQARHGRDYWVTIAAARLSRFRPKVLLFRHLAKSPGSWVSRRFLLGQCDALVGVSEYVARVLREGAYDPGSPEPERHCRPPMLGDLDKICVLHGGFDMDRFVPCETSVLRGGWGLEPGHFAFAVVGGYSPPRGKGQREFLKAAALIHGELPNARFLILGRGGLKAVLEEDILRLGLTGKAWLTPYCSDMPSAMNAIDCLVHPQIGTEALPGVVIEAHACGRPVIATDLDGNLEAFQVGGYGQIVRPESVGELAEAMRTWAGNPGLDLEQRRRLHDRVAERFSLERAAAGMVALHRRLLGPD